MLLRGCALQVRQDLCDDRRLLDAGNDLELPTAARTGLDVDPEGGALEADCATPQKTQRGERATQNDSGPAPTLS